MSRPFFVGDELDLTGLANFIVCSDPNVATATGLIVKFIAEGQTALWLYDASGDAAERFNVTVFAADRPNTYKKGFGFRRRVSKLAGTIFTIQKYGAGSPGSIPTGPAIIVNSITPATLTTPATINYSWYNIDTTLRPNGFNPDVIGISASCQTQGYGVSDTDNPLAASGTGSMSLNYAGDYKLEVSTVNLYYGYFGQPMQANTLITVGGPGPTLVATKNQDGTVTIDWYKLDLAKPAGNGFGATCFRIFTNSGPTSVSTNVSHAISGSMTTGVLDPGTYEFTVQPFETYYGYPTAPTQATVTITI